MAAGPFGRVVDLAARMPRGMAEVECSLLSDVFLPFASRSCIASNVWYSSFNHLLPAHPLATLKP